MLLSRMTFSKEWGVGCIWMSGSLKENIALPVIFWSWMMFRRCLIVKDPQFRYICLHPSFLSQHLAVFVLWVLYSPFILQLFCWVCTSLDTFNRLLSIRYQIVATGSNHYRMWFPSSRDSAHYWGIRKHSVGHMTISGQGGCVRRCGFVWMFECVWFL